MCRSRKSRAKIRHIPALIAFLCSLTLLPSPSEAACSCGGGDGMPLVFSPNAPITVDGDVADWGTTSQPGTVLNDEDNNVCDGPSGGITDPDSPGNGQDIVQFSFTYDDSWLYFYTERVGSANNPQTFIYYADTNLDGYMDNTEPVIVAEWQGNNRQVDVFLATYNPTYAYATTGDPMTDPATGSGDGWSLPGNLSNITGPIALYSGTFGSTNGLAMEFAIQWTALGFSGPAGHAIHVSSTNANKNANNLGSQIDDNLGGCGGGSGSIQFADLDFSGAFTLSGYWGDAVWGIHHLVNLGNADDSFSFAYTISGTWSPTVSLYVDDGDSIFTTGDAPVVAPLELASGGSVDIIIVYDIGSFTSGTATVVTTATSQYNPDADASVTDAIVPLYPDITSVKYVSAVADSTAATPAGADKALPGALITYTIAVTNSGNASADTGSVVVRDTIPSTVWMYIGTGAASPVTFNQGTTSLNYSYTSLASTTDDLGFTSESVPSPAYTYTPVPDAQGYDGAVTGFRIDPEGTFGGSTGFNVTYQVRVP